MGNLVKNSLFNIISTTGGIVFTFITTIYVSRIIFASGVGKVSDAQNLIEYFYLLGSIGFPAYGIRCIAKYKDDSEKRNKIFSELYFINLIMNIFAICLFILLVFLVPTLKSNSTLYIISGIQIFLAILNVDWLFVGLEKYKFIAIRNLAVKTLALVTVFIFVKNENDYIIYALIASLTMGVNYALNFICAQKHVKFRTHSLSFKQHFKPMLSIGIITILSTIFSRIDITMLKVITHDDAIVGYYTNAFKTVNIVLILIASITAVFLPRLAYIKNDQEKVKFLLGKGFNIIFFIALPAAIGLAILAPKFITLLYGETFAAAGLSLRLFSILIIINSIGDLFCFQALIALGKENKRLFLSIGATLVHIGINFLLIPSLKDSGAVVGTLIAEFLTNIVLFIYIVSSLKLKINCKTSIITLITSLIMGGFVVGVCFLPTNDIVICIAGILGGLVIYLLLQTLFKNEVVGDFVNYFKHRKQVSHE